MRGAWRVLIFLVAANLTACRSSLDDRTLRACLVGEGLLADGRADEAIELFEQARARDPDLAANHLVLAAAWSHKDQPTNVEENLRSYLALNPKHVVARLYLGEVLRRQGRTEEAWSQYITYLSSERGRDPKACRRRSHCLLRLTELAKSTKQGEEPVILALTSYDAAIGELALAGPMLTDQQKQAVGSHVSAALAHLEAADPLKTDQAIVDKMKADIALLTKPEQSFDWTALPWPAAHLVPSAGILPWGGLANALTQNTQPSAPLPIKPATTTPPPIETMGLTEPAH